MGLREERRYLVWAVEFQSCSTLKIFASAFCHLSLRRSAAVSDQGKSAYSKSVISRAHPLFPLRECEVNKTIQKPDKSSDSLSPLVISPSMKEVISRPGYRYLSFCPVRITPGERGKSTSLSLIVDGNDCNLGSEGRGTTSSNAASMSDPDPLSRLGFTVCVSSSDLPLASAGGRGKRSKEKRLPPERGELMSLNTKDLPVLILGSGSCRPSALNSSMTFIRFAADSTAGFSLLVRGKVSVRRDSAFSAAVLWVAAVADSTRGEVLDISGIVGRGGRIGPLSP